MCSVKNGFQFMLCCCLSITLLQIIALLFFLPLPLPLAHMLWMICLEIPLLSLSLLGSPVDSHVMTLATGKNSKVANKQVSDILFINSLFNFKLFIIIRIFMFLFIHMILKFTCKVDYRLNYT